MNNFDLLEFERTFGNSWKNITFHCPKCENVAAKRLVIYPKHIEPAYLCHSCGHISLQKQLENYYYIRFGIEMNPVW